MDTLLLSNFICSENPLSALSNGCCYSEQRLSMLITPPLSQFSQPGEKSVQSQEEILESIHH